MKKFKNIVFEGHDGKPLQYTEREGEVKALKTYNMLWVILNNAPIQTQEDSINGLRLAEALDESRDVIEIEDGVHDWLKKVAEKVTPPLFRINGNLVYKFICEGYEEE